MWALSRRQKRIVKSGQVAEICKFIAEADEETRCIMLVKTLRIHKAQGRVDKSRDVIAQLDEERKLPKNFLGEMTREIIGDDKPDAQLVRQLADMTARQLQAMDETALSAACDWLQSGPAVTMLESFIDTNGKKLMEILIEKRPEIACHLLHQGKGVVFKDTLDLLTTVASSDPSKMVREAISDVLEDCVHSKRWTEIAKDILPIAKIVNPIAKSNGIIRVDTAYMMNWCLQEQYFSNPTSMSIHDLIGELCELATCLPALECLDELMELNRMVDLVMFLDQGTKRYRGHDIHQFNVAALGLFLLDTHVKKNNSLKEYLVSVHQDQFSNPGDVQKTWLLASLLHDHAIPISHMFEIAPLICGMLEKKKCDELYKKALRAQRKTLWLTYKRLFSKRLSSVYRNFFESNSKDKEKHLEKLVSKEMSRIGLWEAAKNRFDQLDHGVLGAANIIGRFKNSPLDKNVENSAKAIAVHNLKGVRISFRKDPLAFLLVLCDELQEWGREIAVFPKILIDVSSMMMEGFHTDGGKRFFTDDLRVSFRCLKNTEHTRFKKPVFDGQKKEFVKQRLDFDDCEAFPLIRFGETMLGI